MDVDKDCRSPGNIATLVGSCALTMWALEPILVSTLSSLPLFETLTIVFFTSFIFSVVKITRKKKWHLVRQQPLSLWIFGILGICGSDFTYFFSAQHAPIAHVDLIDFLWPCVLVVLTGLLPSEKIAPKHILGAIFGTSSVWVLLCQQQGIEGIQIEYLPGYFIAFLGTILWASYAIMSRKSPDAPPEMIGLYCGVGILFCIAFHIPLETTVMPSGKELFCCIFTGAIFTGVAYQLWDFSMKRGNIRILTAVAYLEQVFTMSLLIVSGKEPFTIAFLIATILACTGVYLCGQSDDNDTERSDLMPEHA